MKPIENVKCWIEREIGVTAKSMKQLAGGASSLLYEIETEGQSIVLRQIDNKRWLHKEPDLIKHEAASLKKAHTAGLRVPFPLASDETGQANGMPSILMTKVDGKVVLQPEDFHVWTDGLAKSLVEIHRVEAGDFSWKYAPYTHRNDVEIPTWTKKLDVWKAAYEHLQGCAPKYNDTFIHRDFHPANVLWCNKEVSGIVDWVNACRGPAGIDVGHCRINIALLHGVEIADLFLKAYCQHAPEFSYNPYFDIVAIFDSLEGPPTVYKGWIDLGVKGLTNRLMEERMDAFIESVIRGNHCKANK